MTAIARDLTSNNVMTNASDLKSIKTKNGARSLYPCFFDVGSIISNDVHHFQCNSFFFFLGTIIMSFRVIWLKKNTDVPTSKKKIDCRHRAYVISIVQENSVYISRMVSSFGLTPIPLVYTENQYTNTPANVCTRRDSSVSLALFLFRGIVEDVLYAIKQESRRNCTISRVRMNR